MITTILILWGAGQAVHAQGFAVGLVLGLMLGNGGSEGAAQMRQMGLNAIPMRCLAAETEADYTDCRYPSMMAELQAARNNHYVDSNTPFCTALLGPVKKWKDDYLYEEALPHYRSCDIKWHIDLEIKALRSLNESLANQKKN